ncbi:disease resistance protein, partial [Striga asiatica]
MPEMSVTRTGDKRRTNSSSRHSSDTAQTNDNVHEGGTCKPKESTVLTRDGQTKKDVALVKRKADHLVRDVTRVKRTNLTVSTSNQPDSSDDFVNECPRTRHVKTDIKHKGDGKE